MFRFTLVSSLTGTDMNLLLRNLVFVAGKLDTGSETALRIALEEVVVRLVGVEKTRAALKLLRIDLLLNTRNTVVLFTRIRLESFASLGPALP